MAILFGIGKIKMDIFAPFILAYMILFLLMILIMLSKETYLTLLAKIGYIVVIIICMIMIFVFSLVSTGQLTM
jgi:hypothetical protein